MPWVVDLINKLAVAQFNHFVPHTSMIGDIQQELGRTSGPSSGCTTELETS